jgi:predicted CXXCH cytochrome family protein
LLTKPPRQLCFDCHEEKDIAAVKAHASAGERSCVECHDPHLGKDKNLLKPSARTVATAKEGSK